MQGASKMQIYFSGTEKAPPRRSESSKLLFSSYLSKHLDFTNEKMHCTRIISNCFANLKKEQAQSKTQRHWRLFFPSATTLQYGAFHPYEYLLSQVQEHQNRLNTLLLHSSALQDRHRHQQHHFLLPSTQRQHF